jgi:two-component system, NtrC family, sensor kinase
MKILLKIILLLFPSVAFDQQSLPDSLRNTINNAANDSLRYKANWAIINSYYAATNSDTALYLIEQALLLARENNKKLPEARALIYKGQLLSTKGRYAESLKCLLEAFTIAEDPESEKNTWLFDDNFPPEKSRLSTLSYAHNTFALLMLATQNTEQQILHYKKSREIAENINDSSNISRADIGLCRSYLELNMLDSALFFIKSAKKIAVEYGQRRNSLSIILYRLGDIYLQMGDKALAKQYFYESIQSATEQNNKIALCRNYLRLTKYYRLEKEKDSALYYAVKYAGTFQSLGAISATELDNGTAYENLSLAYELNNQFDSAYKYQGLALVTKDSLNNARINSLAEFQNLTLREQFRLQDLEKESIQTKNKIRTYAMLAGLAVFSIIAFILYRNNLQKQKANKVLETTLTNLKSMQAQLIQSEKMASLGELTAGIAHEIQNPLNFVNNFSDVSNELIDEMNAELDKGDINEAKAIATDVKQNLEKINHHGKRADAIVKGMLQHSRTSSSVKEPTDINALADEYLRLSYHGLRAKDKNFNATTKTNFDESIGNINIIPQDMGRVILNLINNAFYAVDEKKKSFELLATSYEPTVTVSTKKAGDKVLVSVKDNGNGIPQKILDKIFQPFFTTKPTGQGTGLGLSLSYDIVKAHGGELKVETEESKGTTFIIRLPLKD